MTASFDLPDPVRFTTGTVGPPGQRVFYLQAADPLQVVTLKLEKQQVAALCDYLAGILADLPEVTEPPPTAMDLSEPVVAEWAVGTLAVAYEQANDRIVLVAEELVETISDDETGEEIPVDIPATARFLLTRSQVAAFIERGNERVTAGRRTCHLCGRPIDPEGHMCPRLN
ncbi:MAG: DUF3090 domain-containing protein [Acidimicrobiia bacterium]|nr:DUF3090 domain-containing protein [Acidimicrobiia bacterium]